EEIELSGGTRLILHPRLLGCVNRGIPPCPRRPALRGIGEHCVPVPVDRVARVQPRPQLPRFGPPSGSLRAAYGFPLSQIEGLSRVNGCLIVPPGGLKAG